MYRHDDTIRSPDAFFGRVFAEVNGDVVGFGSYSRASWCHDPSRYQFSIFVLPEHQRRGIGQKIYAHIRDTLAPLSPSKIGSWSMEDQPASIQFLTRQGFREVMRWPLSQLDVTAFDQSKFAGAERRLNASGMEIKTLSELKRVDPECRRKLWRLHSKIDEDVPAEEPIKPQSWEEYAHLFNTPWFHADGCFIAVDGTDYVGLSMIFSKPSEPEKMEQGITGSLRSHRRRGVATALKVRVIDFVRAFGARYIVTDNEENNPMYDLNRKLGFTPLPAQIGFQIDV